MGVRARSHYFILTRDETIWRYIDTISICRAAIRIVAQRDISRYDPDIHNQGNLIANVFIKVTN